MRFAIINSRPVPHRLAPALMRIKARTGALAQLLRPLPRGEPYLEAARQDEPAAALRGVPPRAPGLQSGQPARLLDARAPQRRRRIPGPARRALPYWCVGMDWTDAPAVVQAAKAEGYMAVVTYPSNPREGHHINSAASRCQAALQAAAAGLARPARPHAHAAPERARVAGDPRAVPRRRAADLRRGHRGRGPALPERAQAAVDGIYGPLTHKQLITSRRRQRRHGA